MAISLTINSTPTTLAFIGVGNIVIHRQILAPDTAEIELVPAARPDSQPMKFGDVVQILDGSTIIYIGTVTKTPRPKLGANLERRSYLLSNVLWSLARQPYQQTWNRNASTTYYKGRVNLGRNLDDSKQTIGEAIADILDHAASLGIDVAYDSDDLDALTTYFPDEEALDVMHIEAITRILRWAPSVTVRVEYASGTTTLRFVPHADETPVSTLYATFRQLEISPLDEQTISGVVLNFETTNTDNDLIYTDVTQQTAGSTTGTDVLRQTIQLEGYVASEQFQEAKVVVDTTWSLSDASFWTDRIIGLQGVTSLVITPEASPVDYSDHPHILLQGPVPEWTSKTVQEYTFNATADFSFGGEDYEDVPLVVRVALTDANTKTYRQTVSSYFRAGESAPSGLAAAILAQFATQQWEGSASIRLNPASFGYAPGQVLAIAAPSGCKWDATGALIPSASAIDGTATISPRIESCVYSIQAVGCGTAELQLTFGPPRHLGARDIVNLYQATRNRNPTQWSRSEPLGSSSTASTFSAGGPVPASTGGMLSMTPDSLPYTELSGQMIYSHSGVPSWLDAPARAAMLVHNGTLPSWLLDPTSGGALLGWDLTYGTRWMSGGYPFAYTTGVSFSLKIPAADLFASNAPQDGYYPQYDSTAGKLVWTQFPAFPDPEQELPAGGTQGELLAFGASSPYWLSAPLGLALLTHDGDDPAWLAVPSSGAGLLVWDYAYGVQMPSGGGYPYAYTTGVKFSLKIPFADIEITGDAGFYGVEISELGAVSLAAIPAMVEGLPSGDTGGELLWSNAGTAAWLAKPAGAAIMVHDGDDPWWRPIPASPGFGGVFGYENGTGFTFANGGYIWAYNGSLEGKYKIPVTDLSTGATEGFYGLAVSALGEVSVQAIPDMVEGLPAGDTGGELLYSYGGTASWLAAPLGAALMLHDGDDPAWLAVPSSGAGLLVWDYAYGVQMPSGGGYPYAYTTGVKFSLKIPFADIEITGDAGFYGVEISELGAVSLAAIPAMVEGLPSGDTGGELLWSNAGTAAWLAKPAGAAIMVHDGDDPWWRPIPASPGFGGVFGYENGTGFTFANGGYIWAYNGSLEGKYKIPVTDLSTGATEGFYGLAVSALGEVSVQAIPDMVEGLPSGGLAGDLLAHGASAPYWFAPPATVGMLIHDGSGLGWAEPPDALGGFLGWNNRGFQFIDGGYPYAYAGSLEARMEIPLADIYSYNDPTDGKVAHCVVLPGNPPAIEWKKIESGALNATNSPTAGYYLAAFADGLFTWTHPDGLPSGDTGGELIYSYGGTASWLAAPVGLALLTHDGDDPAWLAVPSSGAGMMVWDYATGAQMSTGVGYPYAYATGVTFSTRIPANKLSIAGDGGYYILYVDQYGSVSEIAMENLTKHAFSGTGSGRYMLSFDVNGESPALYEIGAGYV